MANYIKIFDDTVLKQSILQGYQAQRTNANLNAFTMGQLAFTRDTGRVFVGNHTTQNNKKTDSKEVAGGILVGNKYLGLIDSKPLGHFSPNNLPLKYGELNISKLTDQAGSSTAIEEPGILTPESYHRKDQNKKWSKDVDYMEQYDAYTGDYMFDVFNNALILFDKNISIKESNQPIYADNNGQNSFVVDGKVTNEPEKVTRRTVLYDNSITTENIQGQTYTERNANYPIYGEGYVIMRILEPDGTTLGYRDRVFDTNGQPKVGKNDQGQWEWENWSHNLIELKSVPSRILIKAMSPQNFYNQGTVVSLQPIQQNVQGFAVTEQKPFVIPTSVMFNNITNQDIINVSENGGKNSLKQSNNYSDKTLNFDINKSSILPQTKYDNVLSVSNNGTVSIATPYRQEFNIRLYDGLVNYITGTDVLKLTFDNNETNQIALGFSSLGQTSSVYRGSRDPFYMGTNSDFYYIGNAYYNKMGCIQETEKWDEAYYSIAKDKIEKYIFDKNTSINYLKTPVTICSKNTIEKPQYSNELQSNDTTDDGSTTDSTTNIITSVKSKCFTNEEPIKASLEFVIKPNVYCIYKQLYDETPFVNTLKTVNVTSTQKMENAYVQKDDGTFILKNGEKQLIYVESESGEQVIKTIPAYERQSDGKYKVDENGNKIPIITKTETTSLLTSKYKFDEDNNITEMQHTWGENQKDADGNEYESSDFQNIISVTGNNEYSSKQEISSYYIIDGYNTQTTDENPFENFTLDNPYRQLYKTEWYLKSNGDTFTDDKDNIIENQSDQQSSNTSINVFTPDNFQESIPEYVSKDSLSSLKYQKLLSVPALATIQIKTIDNESFVSTQDTTTSLLSLSNFFEQDVKIDKIEISTNDKEERTIVIFDTLLLQQDYKDENHSFVSFKFGNYKVGTKQYIDKDGNIVKEDIFKQYFKRNDEIKLADFISDASVGSIETDYGILTVNEKATFLVYREEQNGNIKFKLLTNSPIFTNNTNIPYYLTVSLQDERKKTIRLGGIQDIIDSVSITETIEKSDDKYTLQSNGLEISSVFVKFDDEIMTNISIEDFYNSYCDNITGKITKANQITYTVQNGNTPETLTAQQIVIITKYDSSISVNLSTKYISGENPYEFLTPLELLDEQDDYRVTVAQNDYETILAKITLNGKIVDENGDAAHSSEMGIRYLLESNDQGYSWQPYTADVQNTYELKTDQNGNQQIGINKYFDDNGDACYEQTLSLKEIQSDSQITTEDELIDKLNGLDSEYYYRWSKPEENIIPDIPETSDEIDEEEIESSKQIYGLYEVLDDGEVKTYIWHYDVQHLQIPTIKQSQTNYIVKSTPTYKMGYIYDSNNASSITIPDNANSVILELIRKDSTNQDLAIVIPNIQLTNIQSSDVNYNEGNYPTNKQYVLKSHNYFDKMDDFKTLVLSTSKGITTFEVPLVRTNLNNSKMFSFTVWNINPYETEFNINVKGYRV